MSVVGRPTLLSTITMVNSPAEGTPAAPTAASMAVILTVWGGREREGGERGREGREGGRGERG